MLAIPIITNDYILEFCNHVIELFVTPQLFARMHPKFVGSYTHFHFKKSPARKLREKNSFEELPSVGFLDPLNTPKI